MCLTVWPINPKYSREKNGNIPVVLYLLLVKVHPGGFFIKKA